jgi:hypothetical protein
MVEMGWIMPKFYVRRAMKTLVLMVHLGITRLQNFQMQRNKLPVNVLEIVVNAQKSIVIHRRGNRWQEAFLSPRQKT